MTAAWQLTQLQLDSVNIPQEPLKTVLYRFGLSLGFPLIMAIVPFPGCVSYFKGVLGGLMFA